MVLSHVFFSFWKIILPRLAQGLRTSRTVLVTLKGNQAKEADSSGSLTAAWTLARAIRPSFWLFGGAQPLRGDVGVGGGGCEQLESAPNLAKNKQTNKTLQVSNTPPSTL